MGQNQAKISFLKLFKYSPASQKALVSLGIVSSIISGAAAPSIAVIFGEIVKIFDPNNSTEEI